MNVSSLLSLIPASLLLCSGCGSAPKQAVQPTPDRRLRAIWSAKGVPAKERCAAINACFTNGTPMRDVVAVLGKQDNMIITTSLSWPPETQNQRIWVYRFGSKEVLISSTGAGTTPLDDRGFAGATVGFADSLGQPDGAANGSQPIRSETNRTSGAAGSRR
jgi:hypothetical protein